ncbi:FkbM family methyltransferase [Histidinibacterium lentulum]|nr:FkbM family methyltransferase [Histidinibacterium lentulum]
MAEAPASSVVRDWIGTRLPGKAGRNYRRDLKKRRKSEAEAALMAVLDRISGGLCIDLGANLGVWTRRMAAASDRVIAFEPDPWTAQRLRENVADLPNVTVIEAAAGIRGGRAALYRSRQFEEDRETRSESSSLLSAKSNVDPASGVDVDVIDFPGFISDLDRDIAVLKVDIEGAEVELLEVLLDHPVLSRIGHLFVETHEDRIPDLAARTAALRARARRVAGPVINMDWR